MLCLRGVRDADRDPGAKGYAGGSLDRSLPVTAQLDRSPVDTNTTGSYVVTYTALDPETGDTAIVRRQVGV